MSDFLAVIYSRPRCMKCRATMRAISAMGVPVEEVQLDDFPEKVELMQREGWLELPLVEVTEVSSGEVFRWGGMSTENLTALKYVAGKVA